MKTKEIKKEEPKVLRCFERTAQSYQSWTTLTSECFENKLRCKNCINREDCSLETIHQNPYNISNVKYAVLMTYANIGVNGVGRHRPKLAED